MTPTLIKSDPFFFPFWDLGEDSVRAHEAGCEAVQRKRQGKGTSRSPRVFRTRKSPSTRIALKAIAHLLSFLAIPQRHVFASRPFPNSYPILRL